MFEILKVNSETDKPQQFLCKGDIIQHAVIMPSAAISAILEGLVYTETMIAFTYYTDSLSWVWDLRFIMKDR